MTLFCRKKFQIRQSTDRNDSRSAREPCPVFDLKKKVTRINLTNFLIEPEKELHNFKMFKKFEEKESISGITQLKSSVQKGIRNKLKESYPGLEGLMDDFLPKKDWLLQTVPYFKDPEIGVVQTRWGHINRDYSLLTKIQAFALDFHFILESRNENVS